jgi:hypothetical protein
MLATHLRQVSDAEVAAARADFAGS